MTGNLEAMVKVAVAVAVAGVVLWALMAYARQTAGAAAAVAAAAESVLLAAAAARAVAQVLASPPRVVVSWLRPPQLLPARVVGVAPAVTLDLVNLVEALVFLVLALMTAAGVVTVAMAGTEVLAAPAVVARAGAVAVWRASLMRSKRTCCPAWFANSALVVPVVPEGHRPRAPKEERA